MMWAAADNGNFILTAVKGVSNNMATVTDAGSLLSNAVNLYVGYFGSGNQLVVASGVAGLNTSPALQPWSLINCKDRSICSEASG